MISVFQKLNKNAKFITINAVLLFVLSNLFLSDFYCRKDISRENRFNLTESTEKIIKNLPEKLYIDAYYSSDVPGVHRARLNLAIELIKEIASINRDKVELRFHDPDSNDSEKKRAVDSGIKPNTLDRQERGSVEIKQAYFGLTLRVGSASTVIPEAYFAERIEYQILSSLKKMLKKENTSSVAIVKAPGAFTAPEPGPGITKDTFGVFFKKIFEPENGEVKEISVNEESISEEIKTLVLAGSPNLDDKGRYHIDQFLMRGGNLVVFAKTMEFNLGKNRNRNPMYGMGNEGMAQALNDNAAVKQFFSHYGFEVQNNMILEPDNSVAIENIFSLLDTGEAYHNPFWITPRNNDSTINTNSIFTKNTSALLMPWTSSIEMKKDNQKNAVFTVLAESTLQADKRADMILLNEDHLSKQSLTPQNTKFTLGLHIEGTLNSYFKKESIPRDENEVFLEKTRDGKKSQIIVFGSPYMLSDLMFTEDYYIQLFQKTNYGFALNLFDILNGDTDLLATRSKHAYTKNLKDVSKAEKGFYSAINIALIPILISIYAFIRIKKRISRR